MNPATSCSWLLVGFANDAQWAVHCGIFPDFLPLSYVGSIETTEETPISKPHKCQDHVFAPPVPFAGNLGTVRECPPVN